jgi:hypothetical protein
MSAARDTDALGACDHEWCATGTTKSWCKKCNQDATWDTQLLCWVEVYDGDNSNTESDIPEGVVDSGSTVSGSPGATHIYNLSGGTLTFPDGTVVAPGAGVRWDDPKAPVIEQINKQLGRQP